jgi:hypothetical protein
VLRERGLLAVREELGRELLDAGASAAFAVADHQVAHVYVNDRSQLQRVADLIRGTSGIAEVLSREDQKQIGLDHERSGELVAVAERGAWCTYYYWLEDRAAPDFAWTVDIHRKPGYDPAELFLDPNLSLAKLQIGWKLLKRRLGTRTLLDVIALDASLVRGSHGRRPADQNSAPLFISSSPVEVPAILQPTQCRDVLLSHVFD